MPCSIYVQNSLSFPAVSIRECSTYSMCSMFVPILAGSFISAASSSAKVPNDPSVNVEQRDYPMEQSRYLGQHLMTQNRAGTANEEEADLGGGGGDGENSSFNYGKENEWVYPFATKKEWSAYKDN